MSDKLKYSYLCAVGARQLFGLQKQDKLKVKQGPDLSVQLDSLLASLLGQVILVNAIHVHVYVYQTHDMFTKIT